MIRVIIFDLGLTLVDDRQRPFDHVPEALAAIAGFRTADSKPLRSCVVSDFTMVAPPITAAKIRPVFDEYVAILESTGLREFFEPISKRVTLSTHVGLNKPARALFERALKRLQSRASMSECLFITENANHVRAARGVETVSAKAADTSGKIHVAGRIWHKLSVPGHPELGDVHVQIPVEGELERGPTGKLLGELPKRPNREQLAEASAFVQSLATHGQIAEGGRSPARRATHAIETDAQGRRKLVRKRFSAV